MAEKVVVKGGGTLDGAQFENAASEATLQEILKALRGAGAGGGGSGGGAAANRVQSLYNRLLTTSNEELRRNSDAFSSSTSAVKSFTGGIISAAGAGIGAVFGLAASAGQGLIKFLLEGTDSFQKLSSVGAGFNGDLQEIAKAASSSGMSMEAFTNLVTKNNTALVALGGNAQAGAIKIGQVSKELTQGQIGDKLFGLGLTVNDINDYMGSYLEQQSRLGGMSKKSTTELAQGAAIYAEELDKVTKLTGIQRKDLEKQAAKLAVDPIITKMMSSIDRTTKEGEAQYQKGIANMAAAAEMGGDEYQQALKEVASGVVKSDLAKSLMTVGGVSQQAAREVVLGQREIGGLTKQVNERFADNIKGLADGQVAGSQLLQGQQKLVSNTNKFEADQNSAQGKQLAENKKTAAQIAQIGTLFTKVYNYVLNKVVGSSAFTQLMKFIEDVATQFDNSKGGIFDLIDTLANGLGDAFGKMIEAFKSGGLISALKTGFSEVFKLLQPIVGDLFKGMLGGGKSKEGLQAKRDTLSAASQSADGAHLVSLEQQIAAIDAEIASIGSDSQPIDIFETMKNSVKELLPFLEPLTNSQPIDIFEIMKNSVKELLPFLEPLTNILKGIEWAMANWGTVLLGAGGAVLAIGALSLALGPVGSALTAVLTPVSLVLAAFGMAAGGLGFMFQGISKIIDSFVNGFKSIPVVLGELANLDSNKLKGIASAMGDISIALGKLAGGGILSSLFGTGGLPDFIKSAKELEVINSDSIKNTVSAVSSVKGIGTDLGKQAEGVKTFADNIKNLTDRIKDLQVALEKLNKTPGGTGAVTSAAPASSSASASASGGEATSASADKLDKLNILMTELVSVNKEIRGFEKDLVDAVKGRNSAMGGK